MTSLYDGRVAGAFHQSVNRRAFPRRQVLLNAEYEGRRRLPRERTRAKGVWEPQTRFPALALLLSHARGGRG